MVENQYIQGYLSYWDYLRAHVPELLIDACASGGRRNDLETMRRAVPLHQTDFGYGHHPVQQAFSQMLYSWIPYFRGFCESSENPDGSYAAAVGGLAEPGVQHPDDFLLLQAVAPVMSLGGFEYGNGYKCEADFSDGEHLKRIQRAISVYRQAVDYIIDGDFYALTPYHKSSKRWTVWQFHNEERGEGILKVIRNNAAPDESVTVRLRAAEGAKRVLPENLQTGERREIGADEAAALTFTQPVRSVSIWKYSYQ